MVLRNGFLALAGLFLCFTSCNVINPDESIPSYLRIEKIEYIDSVTNLPAKDIVHKFSDAWVFIDDQFVGVYPLPANFPVFYEGEHKVSVSPGILKNGISSTRLAYPFFTQYNSQVKFSKETETVVIPKTTYIPSTKYKFVEDYENTSSGFDTVNSLSDVKLDRTNISDQVFQGTFSGMVTLIDTLDRFFMQTTAEYTFAKKLFPTYLEINYNSEVDLQIGMYANNSGAVNIIPKIGLRSTNGTWRKVYIDLSPEITEFDPSTKFRIFIKADKPSDIAKAVFYLDNIKLVF